MKSSQLCLATSAAAIAAMLAVPAASAGDIKIFPGSFCQQSFTDSTALVYDYSLTGGLLSMEAPGGTSSAFSADISCPILRENQTNTTGLKFSAWVNDFWGDGEGDQVTCSVGIRASNGSGRLDWETRSTAPGATGMIKLDWGTSLSTGGVDAIYYMDCTIPTYSGLSSYRTDEP